MLIIYYGLEELKGLDLGVLLCKASACMDFEPCFLTDRELRLRISGFGALGSGVTDLGGFNA